MGSMHRFILGTTDIIVSGIMGTAITASGMPLVMVGTTVTTEPEKNDTGQLPNPPWISKPVQRRLVQ
jgi:hypothetical protein